MSPKDMGRLLRAMLNYEQLSPLVTHRWLKPTSHTTDLYSSVGAPWEIKRVNGLSKYHNIDWYEKGGYIPPYATQYIIIPDLEIGISIQAAIGGNSSPIATIEDYIQQAINPTLYEIAREQALQKFGGLYTMDGSNSTGSQKNVSSILITADAAPGLVLADFTLQGQKITNNLTDLPNSKSSRLYPMVMANTDPKSEQFRVVAQNDNTECVSWIYIDTNLGIQPLDNFIFEIGSNGIVESVFNPGLRLRLRKVR
jgi:hypothetical protein